MFERKIIFPKESPKEIYNYLVSRRVKTLVHFTPIENVKSIMENGICSLDVQEELGIYSLRTDRDRFDGLRNYNSCSISFPNYKMMAYKKRNSKFRFAVLTLDIELLKDLEYGDVVVSESNAARANSLSNSIQDLFKECAKNLRTGQKSTRKELGIVYDYYTTDPQAEVLIRNTIPPEHIKSIFIRNDDIKYAKEKGIDYKNVIWGGNSRFFSSRHDDAFWNSTNPKILAKKREAEGMFGMLDEYDFDTEFYYDDEEYEEFGYDESLPYNDSVPEGFFPWEQDEFEYPEDRYLEEEQREITYDDIVGGGF